MILPTMAWAAALAMAPETPSAWETALATATTAKAELVLRADLTPKAIAWPTGWHYVQPGEVTLPGNHWHVCAHCGRAVQHGPENNGNTRAHTCVCGMVHWEKSPKPQPASFTKPKPAPYCPT